MVLLYYRRKFRDDSFCGLSFLIMQRRRWTYWAKSTTEIICG
nr:MAG TPA_asm: hypothetical protein [Caudoviricetes sp.]DAR54338.1 MAG TPA: hypothetical protein [Caudoviricetes sp.]